MKNQYRLANKLCTKCQKELRKTRGEYAIGMCAKCCSASQRARKGNE